MRQELACGVFAFLTLGLFAFPAMGEEMTLERVDNQQTLILKDDQTYEVRWLYKNAQTPVARGVFEVVACWNVKYPDSNRGNYMFYTDNGESCCMDFRAVGSKRLLNRISGFAYGVCMGGVYQQK